MVSASGDARLSTNLLPDVRIFVLVAVLARQVTRRSRLFLALLIVGRIEAATIAGGVASCLVFALSSVGFGGGRARSVAALPRREQLLLT
mmetsp:Transcript_31130/g.41231  ORF Transcript_31130/g.41231 Transcript_31130/m.41231 type:complete len:90 (+) Transcript_31130:1818-2087(+)